MQTLSGEHFIKRRPEEIYSSIDNSQKLSYFLSSNRIISSSEPILDFLHGFDNYSIEGQEKMLS